jgi:murein DD-endopeptidase MepM/ murein hydrolase activator NlpD
MPEGEPIKAARGGVVTAAVGYYSSGGLDQGYKSKGNHVIIRHDDGTYAEYYHLRKKGVVVSLGATVSAGDLIGYSGNTGYSGGPHLHFAVFRNLDVQRRETFPLRFRTANGQLIENPQVGDIH